MSTVVPLFPLPQAFLFPGQLMPLNIFEARYREMVEDLLDTPGRLVIGTILGDQPDEGPDNQKPAVMSVAGFGEIARHSRLPDGRFSILVLGLARMWIDEIGSDRSYRQVEVAEWAEQSAPEERAEELKEPLLEAIHARTSVEKSSLREITTGQLADVLAQCLRLPQPRMEEIFAEPEVAVRAEHVLAAHDEFPAG